MRVTELNLIELKLLEISLWTFFFTFVVKFTVFGVLGWMMRGGGDDLIGLDPAMRRHYWSLCAQAGILATLYLHYAMEVSGDSFIPIQGRIFVYIAGIISVVFAAWFGVALLHTYRLARQRMAQMGGEIALLMKQLEAKGAS